MAYGTSLNKHSFLSPLDGQMHYVEYMYDNGYDDFPDGRSGENMYTGENNYTLLYTPENKHLKVFSCCRIFFSDVCFVY